MRFRLSLQLQFIAILVLVFAGGAGLCALALSRSVDRIAEQEIAAQSNLLINTMNAVRQYTSEQVNPLLKDELYTADVFISQTVPSYSAHQVFRNFQDNLGSTVYNYKEATLNPTNPIDLADDFEAELVRTFQANPGLEELRGVRVINGVERHYTARPLSVSSESCLECHSTPDVAPVSLIAQFGDEGGFGWEVGDIIAAQIIYVPQGSVAAIASDVMGSIMLIVLSVFLLATAAVTVLLRQVVVRPVAHIAGLANVIAQGGLSEAHLKNAHITRIAGRQDELGQLTQTFLSMANEVYQREKELREELAHQEAAQQEQERKLKLLMETDPNSFEKLLPGLLYTDHEGKTVFYNLHLIQMLQYDRQTPLVGVPAANVLRIPEAALNTVIEAAKKNPGEIQALKTEEVEIYCLPELAYDANGRFIGLNLAIGNTAVPAGRASQ